MHDAAHARTVISIDGARKAFGAVKALDGVNFTVKAGECVGLVGHNGAGKSTLVNAINGGLSLDQGAISLGEAGPESAYSIARARSGGIRCVFQELSLCPNLTVAENVRIAHQHLTGLDWRRRAAGVIMAQLDAVFPGHRIDPGAVVGDLSIAERQMVEIATAFSTNGSPVALVILDEPTSSLDASRAHQLIAYVKEYTARGGAVIFISHILGEIIEASDRIVVMRDGKVVSARPASEFTIAGLVQAMGSVAADKQARRQNAEHGADEKPVLTTTRAGDATPLTAYRGELIGLAGLSGHGQTKMLVDLYIGLTSDWVAQRNPRAAFVAGDRLVDGVFPTWDILRNMTLTVLPDWVRNGFVDVAREVGFGEQWRKRIGVRTDNLTNPILSLSGGNQQKILFARALGSRAEIVFMDDPMRGVDIGTKQDVYTMLRQEADKGRTFIWYSTEMDEVCVCDRVYVFREGQIVGELQGDAVTEANILAASFGERAA
jgi:ribose transport system ATP-binding protein